MTELINLTYRHRRAQFPIAIGEESARGKGYAKEIIPLVLEFAFMELDLLKVYLLAMGNNAYARLMFEKAGFQEEAVMRSHYLLHGEYYDIYQHAVL